MSQDDELGAFLRSEIPTSGPGYWDDIEARLHQLEAEQDDIESRPQADPEHVDPEHAVADHAVPEPGLQAVPEISELSPLDVQTDANVIRLRDMRHPEPIPKHNRTLLPMLAAAAVVVIAVAGGLFALAQNQPDVQIDAASPEGSEQSRTDTSGTDTPGTDAPGTDTPETDTPGTDTPETDTPDTDSASDQEAITDESTVPDRTVEEGSVWITSSTELIQGMLSPAGEPMEGQFSIFPLIATGQQAEANDRVWFEMIPFRQQPATWYPADLLEKVADPLPSVEPSMVVVLAESPVTRGLAPDVADIAKPGDTLSATGIRASADGVDWVLIDSEIPFWVTDESVAFFDDEGIEGFDRRQCFGDDDSLLVVDFSADAVSFTARFNYLDSTLLASGIRTSTADPLFVVDTSAIGSAEENGEPVIVRERWEATDAGIVAGDRGSVPLISCDTMTEEVGGLEAFIADDMLLPIPS